VAVYLDTSALVKLVVVEPESTALRRWLRASPRARVTSDLARAELLRAVRAARAGDRALAQARRVLSRVSSMPLSREVLDGAGMLEPVALRSLDAIHLASALTLADQLEVIVTYDDRLATAAAAAGAAVAAPA
jgi:predicted nucleic acid-binding protein